MIGWLLGRVSWKTFFAGAATATVGGTIFRPILVSVVKAGMGAQQVVSDAVRQAMVESAKIREEAASQRAAAANPEDLTKELRSLREEVSSLKAGISGGRVTQ
jgi:hypothetical protein